MLARSGAAFGLQRLIKRLINPSRQHVARLRGGAIRIRRSYGTG